MQQLCPFFLSTILFITSCAVPPHIVLLPTAAAEDVNSNIAALAAVGTTITKPLPIGSPERGEQLLEEKACAGCHLIGKIYAGPSWKAEFYANNKGIGQRAKERWQQAAYTGNATNATEYLFESIVSPNAYVIEGYASHTMPTTFGEILTDQDIADIIAFLIHIE